MQSRTTGASSIVEAADAKSLPATTRCRACGGDVVVVIDLGQQPPGGSFPLPDEALALGMRLRLGVCHSCGLTQLADSSPPEADDPAGPTPLSSATVGAHARRFVDDLIRRGVASPTSRTLSLASHGGHLGTILGEKAVPVTVLDPVGERIRRFADAGVPAIRGGFDESPPPDTEHLGLFDLIVDFYLLAHVRDPRSAFVRIASLLAPTGTLVCEFDHLLATVEGGQWDAIRHGHNSYLTLSWLAREAQDVGLSVIDAVPQPVYGGALRVFVGANRDASPAVSQIERREADALLGAPSGLAPLRDAVERARVEVVSYLETARASAQLVVGYGAPARSITFLNALGVGPDLLPYVVDRSPGKHGRVVPGVGIPIRPVEVLLEDPPAEILVLTWDLIDEVRVALAPVVDRGSRLLVALPRLADVTGGVPRDIGVGR
jgi:SAM-dependent methyltransferase